MTATDPKVLDGVPQRYFDAWNGRDVHGLDGLLAEEFSWVDPLLPAPLVNLDGAHAFLQGSWAGLSDIRFELVGEPAVDEVGSRVAQEWRMLCTHDGAFNGIPATGKTVDILGTDVFGVDASGRVNDIRAYYDSLTVLRQLGLA